MKIVPLLLLAALGLGTPKLTAEPITSLEGWTLEGDVRMDPTRTGPAGGPSIVMSPGSQATLKIREGDGSGRVSFAVYDDGTSAMEGSGKAVGPRWGTTSSNGRAFLGAIMYAKFLQPGGSLCLLDTDPKDRGAWLAMNFVAARGEPGWKQWDFNFDAEKGVTVTIDGQLVPEKYFNWNKSQVTGFNGITLFGDSTPGEKAQTLWISEIAFEQGPPMKAKPTDAPAATTAATPASKPAKPTYTGPTPEEETRLGKIPAVPGSMMNFKPGARLLDDVRGLTVPLVEGYAAERPRLRYSPEDKPALLKRMAAQPELWKAVMNSARSAINPESVPTEEVIRTGSKYWRIERVESAALAWYLTGDDTYKEGAVRWMLAHCAVPVWGDGYRPNLDLVASWYLYHISMAYDVFAESLTEEERNTIRQGISDHAKALYEVYEPRNPELMLNYDQNHSYIPTVAMLAGALALQGEVPEAQDWLTRGFAVLRRSRYALGDDGYYYEGVGYWTYALNWHVRGAELLERATGEPLFELPILKENWRFSLHMSLPGAPSLFGIGDIGTWKGSELGDLGVTNYGMLWEIASRTGSRESRTAGDFYHARKQDLDYPATNFLWFPENVEPLPLEDFAPYQYFADHGVVTWRSGWDQEATAYYFRSGPPVGHQAAEKLTQMADWRINAGHVHPDIGGFLMFAKGEYLVVDTGYTAEKWTKDHNTLLIDGKGQGADGSYWNDRHMPYADFDGARITAQFLSPEYGFAVGDFGSAYRNQVKDVQVRRSMLMTKDWLLIVDDLEALQPHELTWLCHSAAEFKPQEGGGWLAQQDQAGLAVLTLAPTDAVPQAQPTTVIGGTGPLNGTAVQRGYHLALKSAKPVVKQRFVNLLVPVGTGEKAPTVKSQALDGTRLTLELQWPEGRTESVELDLAWTSGDLGPAKLTH